MIGTWCILQVIAILGMSIVRMVPGVFNLFKGEQEASSSSPSSSSSTTTSINAMWVALLTLLTLVWCGIMAYEGYKGFHLSFCPIVVDRAFSIDGPSVVPLPVILLGGGPYAMGLFLADNHRLVTSWLLVIMIFWMVKIVNMLSYPFRDMVNAGILVGVSIGILSLVWLSARRTKLIFEAIAEHERIQKTRLTR